MSDTTFETLFEQARQLPPKERLHLVERLVATLQVELSTPRTEWQQFLRETYGVLKDTPIKRWDQGEYETREPLE